MSKCIHLDDIQVAQLEELFAANGRLDAILRDAKDDVVRAAMLRYVHTKTGDMLNETYERLEESIDKRG